MPRSELFIGNLVNDVQNRDVEEIFDKYGPILKCEVKNKGPGSSFCFVEYQDERDAEEALRSENGRDLLGNPMVVEWAKGKRFDSSRRDDRYGGGGGRYGGDRFDDRRDGGRGGFRGGRGGGGGGGGECFNCGERGHFARDCRSGSSRGGGDRDRGRYGGRDSGRRRSRSRSHS